MQECLKLNANSITKLMSFKFIMEDKYLIYTLRDNAITVQRLTFHNHPDVCNISYVWCYMSGFIAMNYV